MKKFIRLISIFLVAFALCTGCSEDTTADLDSDTSGGGNDSSTATEFTVSFNSNGGTTVASQIVDKYDSAEEPETPVKSGYTFEGWFEDEAMTLAFDFVIPVVADVKLYAMWLEEVYTVTFHYQDDEDTTEETTVSFGSSVETPNPPSRLDYEWEGWFTAAEGGEEYAFEVIDEASIPEDGAIDIYAQWNEVPTVAIVYLYSAASYDVAVGEEAVEPFNTQYIRDGGSLPEIVADDVENYNTDGVWYTDPDCTVEYVTGTVYNYVDGAAVEEIHLYAKWDINTYTVTFETYDGDAIAALEDVPYGTIYDEVTFPKAEYTGYNLDGWYTNQWFGIEFVVGETEVTSDLTLYAKWSAKTYKVIFDFHGGEYTGSYYMDNGATRYETEVTFGESIAEPTSIYYDLEYDGVNYTFLDEWYIDEINPTDDDDYDSKKYTFDPIDADDVLGLVDEIDGVETITLYARWGIRVTIQFNSDIDYSGTYNIYSRQFLKSGEEATEESLSAATIQGYSNDGTWYSDSGCTTEYLFNGTNNLYDNVIESETVELFAKWTINTYTVTYDLNNTIVQVAKPDDDKITYNESIADLPFTVDDESDGYVFEGWYTDKSCTTEFEEGVTKVLGDMTLYAKWRVGGTIYVTYKYDDGGVTADVVKKYTYDENWETFGTTSAPDAPTKSGATFIGWYVTPDDGGELTEIYDFSTNLTTTLSLTAKYWDDDATDFDLYNIDEFLLFRDLTNEGKMLSANITLKTDIDLSTVCGADLGDWTPIANNATVDTDLYPFTGTFDGGDHTISNLYSVSATGHNRSLFSLVKDATIKNVHMVDVYIVNSGTSNYNAAIAGYIPAAGTVYLTNCSTTGGSISGSNQCGGIFGATGVGTVVIDDCHNYGTSVATSGNFAGGIVSRTYTTGSNAVNSKITNCSNSGTITGGSGYGGGIVGELSCSAQIIGCFNTGTIAANKTYQGGIAAIAQYWTTNDDASIIACYNLGTISATTVSNVGGILGGVYTKTGSKVSITSCFNMGTISTTGTTGGILGNSNGTATLTANYFVGYPSYGKGDATADVAGATRCSAITNFTSDYVDVMNEACEDYGYKFTYVSGSNPTLSAIE